MKAATYARVSTERQAERGTIGSQLEALRAHVAAAGHELAGEYRDDGHSGARLDRPGLDALRDAAEAGLFEVVCCLSPDRLARSYAYQVLILDELARLGVSVAFTDAPALDQDDPQARLLTQVQGVIAEYERAKIGERYRRGKLFRSRAGEVISRKAPYGYRRIPRGPDGPAHLEIYEPEAAIARRIFAERASGTTIRQICRQLNAGAVPTPTGSRAVWGTSTLARILRSEAYIGRVYFNRTETVPARRPGQQSRQIPRPRAEWIAIPCPPLISEETFEAASKGERPLALSGTQEGSCLRRAYSLEEESELDRPAGHWVEDPAGVVDSGLAWPSTAEIVGSGTAARSSLDAALWRRNRVPAFTSVTPALRNVSAITRWMEA